MTDSFNPSVLTADATRSSDADLLKALASGARRPRGRPVGSKNKPKMDQQTGQLTGGPKPRVSDDEAKKKADAKSKRAKELEARIITEGNEALMQLFVSSGVPAQFLWKNPPEAAVINSNYTPWANRIAIQPTTAKVLGLTIAELEGSSVGTQLAARAMQDSPLRLGILSIASALLIGRQVKAVLDLRKELEPIITAARQYRENESRRQENGEGQMEGVQGAGIN